MFRFFQLLLRSCVFQPLTTSWTHLCRRLFFPFLCPPTPSSRRRRSGPSSPSVAVTSICMSRHATVTSSFLFLSLRSVFFPGSWNSVFPIHSLSLPLSLTLSHTHMHTHIHSLSLPSWFFLVDMRDCLDRSPTPDCRWPERVSGFVCMRRNNRTDFNSLEPLRLAECESRDEKFSVTWPLRQKRRDKSEERAKSWVEASLKISIFGFLFSSWKRQLRQNLKRREADDGSRRRRRRSKKQNPAPWRSKKMFLNSNLTLARLFFFLVSYLRVALKELISVIKINKVMITHYVDKWVSFVSSPNEKFLRPRY